MFAMRRVVLAGAVAVGTVVGSVVGSVAVAVGPEADVAHHGHASLLDGRLAVLVLSRNLGPSTLEDATVRVRFSEPVVGRLPVGCVWGGEQVALCSTGALPSGGARRDLVLELRTVGTPSEITVRVDTAWNGGATDRDPTNNDHRVLVLATGDPYVF